jgi:hypothetical protein
MSNGNAVSVGLFKKLPHDTQKDLAPITTLGYFDLGIFVTAMAAFDPKTTAAAATADMTQRDTGWIAQLAVNRSL